jgi:hypothetical protein
MNYNVLYCFLCFMSLHIFVWFSTNLQLLDAPSIKPIYISLLLCVPTTLAAYFGTKFGYAAFEAAWSIRFFGFAVSYFVFPILTWWILGESMFTTKTILCILLSFLILAIQIYM